MLGVGKRLSDDTRLVLRVDKRLSNDTRRVTSDKRLSDDTRSVRADVPRSNVLSNGDQPRIRQLT